LACEWYQYVPASGGASRYSNVSPGSTSRCVSSVPSISAGTRNPCQWITVASGSSFVNRTTIDSPTRASMVGPGTWPLKA
jgi:hypothetical protein